MEPAGASWGHGGNQENGNSSSGSNGGGGVVSNGEIFSPFALPLSALECAVCLSLVCQPVSLSCGHSFCRVCLVNTLRRDKKKCPKCRAVCHTSAEDQPEDVVIADIARTCFPELAAQRAREVEADTNDLMSVLPIFYYNVPMFPGETLQLHLFEPRYKLMMRRIVNTSRRFAYVPNYTGYVATLGDVALVANVTECEFLSDGRVLLVAKLSGRHTVIDHFVEEGTQGLHYCRLEERIDEPPLPAGSDASARLEELHARTRQLAQRVVEPVASQVTERYGEMPESAEGFSLWAASVLPMPLPYKRALLSGRSTSERLLACERHLASVMGRAPPAPVERRDMTAIAEAFVRQIAEGSQTEESLVAQAAGGPDPSGARGGGGGVAVIGGGGPGRGGGDGGGGGDDDDEDMGEGN